MTASQSTKSVAFCIAKVSVDDTSASTSDGFLSIKSASDGSRFQLALSHPYLIVVNAFSRWKDLVVLVENRGKHYIVEEMASSVLLTPSDLSCRNTAVATHSVAC